jgi:hypothetical protein
MDPKLLRNWGMAFGAAAMAGAVSLAVLTGQPQAPDHGAGPVIAAPMPSAAAAGEPTHAAPEPVAEPAAAEPAPSSRPAFLVHFSTTHPLGRAQALASQGRDAEARALVERTLARRGELRGLCFQRFTLGGAEIVFTSCAPLTDAQSESFSARWSRRFQTMAGVDYAEPNLVADVESGAGRQ